MIPTTTVNGYSLVLIPKSWAFGAWHRPHKSIYSLGPFRFAVHRALGPWKPGASTGKTCGYVGPCGWQGR